jgi:hypothetical protein
MRPPEQHLRGLYGFAFPDDFSRFGEFLGRLPPGLLGEACVMYPAYPFDVASGRPPTDHPEHPLWEGRYYHDLPEFLTLFTGTTDGLHWGYFFDAPGELPPVVTHYWHSDTFQHTVDGDTVFEAVRWQVELSERDFQEMADMDPGEAHYAQARLGQLDVLRDALARQWDASRPETGDDYLDAYGGSAWRKPAAPTWSDLGVLVSGDCYRPLSADPFKARHPDPTRPEVETAAAEALRLAGQGFPGAALKLGHDLWVWATDFPECYELLDAAYATLGRQPLRRLVTEARAFRQWCDTRRG